MQPVRSTYEMKFLAEDIPYLHPLAANIARMFADDFSRRHSLPEGEGQALATELGFFLHTLLTMIDDLIDQRMELVVEKLPSFPAPLLREYSAMLKESIRSSIAVEWSDGDENGGEPVRIAPLVPS